MKAHLKSVLLAAVVLLGSFSPAAAVMVELPDGYVGHTRLLPVIIHRIFPPYLGQHVYLRPLPPKRGPYRFAPLPMAAPMPGPFFGPEVVVW